MEITKKFSKSSFLTPEAASYLNDAIKKGQEKSIDDEMVYAGLHNEKLGKLNFKRTEKNKERFRGRRKGSKKKRGRTSTN